MLLLMMSQSVIFAPQLTEIPEKIVVVVVVVDVVDVAADDGDDDLQYQTVKNVKPFVSLRLAKMTIEVVMVGYQEYLQITNYFDEKKK